MAIERQWTTPKWGSRTIKSRRTLIVAVALALAVAAGAAAYLFLNGVQQRAYHNAKLTKAYVVQSAIPKGTLGSTVFESGLAKQVQVPEQVLPLDAIQDIAAIRDQITVANLQPGQVLSAGLFALPSSSGNAGTTAQAIPKGDVAITISVDSVHSVASLIQPGDQVDVLIEVGGAEQFLYQNVHILAIGSNVAGVNPSASPAAPSNGGLITFAVPPAAAQRIALAQSGGGGVSGSLYLALVPPGNNATRQPPINAGNLIPASVSP